jgi:hypothetical protein
MAIRYWDYGAATTVWTTAANWSADTAPVANDEVIFDDRSVVAPLTGMAVGDTGGVDFDLLHFKEGYTGGIAAAATPLHTSAQKIIIDGSGSYYIEVSEDATGKDQTIPLIIINNKDAVVYLSSNQNDGSWCCQFTTIILIRGTLDIGGENVDTAFQYLYMCPAEKKRSNVTCTIHEDCIRSKATAYDPTIYMFNGTCTCDSALLAVYMMDGAFTYGSDGAAETGMDIDVLHLYGGTFTWQPDDSGDDAYIEKAWIYGGVFDASTSVNNDRIKYLGNGAGNDVYVFHGATLDIANGRGNVELAASSQLFTIGEPTIIFDSHTQVSMDYDIP